MTAGVCFGVTSSTTDVTAPDDGGGGATSTAGTTFILLELCFFFRRGGPSGVTSEPKKYSTNACSRAISDAADSGLSDGEGEGYGTSISTALSPVTPDFARKSSKITRHSSTVVARDIKRCISCMSLTTVCGGASGTIGGGALRVI